MDNRFKEWVDYINISQKEIAERTGLNRQQISEYYRGIVRTIGGANRRKLADALGITEQQFLSGPPAKPEQENIALPIPQSSDEKKVLGEIVEIVTYLSNEDRDVVLKMLRGFREGSAENSGGYPATRRA